MDAYAERNELLLCLGYRNYRQYLRSDVWKRIRSEQLEKESNCYGCFCPAEAVHHGRYTEENLTGQTGKDLYSICTRCHEKCEVTQSGYKRNPIDATRTLSRMRKMTLALKALKFNR